MTREEALAFRQKEFEEALGFDHAPGSTEFEDSMDSLDLLYGNDPLKEDQYLVGGFLRDAEKYKNIPERLVLWTIKEPYYEKILTAANGTYWKVYQKFEEDPYAGNFVDLYTAMDSSDWGNPWDKDEWEEQDFTRTEGHECEQIIYNLGFMRPVLPDIPFMVDPVPIIPDIHIPSPGIQSILIGEGSCLILTKGEYGSTVTLDTDIDCLREAILGSTSLSIGGSSKVLIKNGNTLGWASVTEC